MQIVGFLPFRNRATFTQPCILPTFEFPSFHSLSRTIRLLQAMTRIVLWYPLFAPSLGVPARLDWHHVQFHPTHSSLTDDRPVYGVYSVVPISRWEVSHRPSHCCGVARDTFFAFSLLTYPTHPISHSSLARDPQPRLVFQRKHRFLKVCGQPNISLANACSMSPNSRRPWAPAGPTHTQKRGVGALEEDKAHLQCKNKKTSATTSNVPSRSSK